MALDVGSTVGDFEVLELVGRGGMGKVFKVRNLITERIEAMKVLLADACEKPEVAARFQREIRLLASLNHPNVAALRTALRVENQLVMIMELVEGASLEQLLADGKVDVPRGVEIISQVLDGLSYAHRKGVIHRDIKPSNILVTAEGSAKLTDFGIASKQGDPKLTATGMALGSLYYMSPEQVKTAPLDPRSDLYSVGVTLYETTTGRRPIEGDSFHSIMLGHLEQRPRPPVEVNPRLAPELSLIIEKSLEKAPEKRFQTAEEFRAALLEPQSYREPSAGGSRTASLMVPAAAPPPDAVWDSAQLERVRKELAAYIGPMAKVLVSRAAKRARSLPQLYEILAAEITSEKDRQKFLGSRRT